MFGNSKSSVKKHRPKSTQAFLRIAEIKQDSLIMNDGTLRAILAVSSTNFDLKSQDEQNALIFGYQRFVNSLDFPLQILLQSRKMDINDYLESLKRLAEKQTNELLRMQTAEYIEFIDQLVESANIMNKNFYCVVPYHQSVKSGPVGLLSRILGTGKAQEISERGKNFEKFKVLLDERATSTAAGLSGMGLRAVRLTTDQLIELLYNSYNFAAGPAIDASQLENVTLTQETQ